MCAEKLQITHLADEWNSTKGGLSTMNRGLAIELAKHPNVSVTFFVPKCTDVDKIAAGKHNIRIVEATERPGYDPLDWLSFPPRDLVTDVIIGHGVKLGKQAQVIRDYHDCSCWLQVVHTAPEKLAMFKTYSGAITKGDEKQWAEIRLCTIADLVLAVGPKLYDIYSRYLNHSEKIVMNLTPGIFSELSDLKQSTQDSKKFWVLVFGRGDSEDFELKGFDIAARAVAELNDKSYQLIFVGAPSGKGEQVAEKLLEQGLSRNQLTVKGYLENRDDLAMLLSTANLALIPSRTEGFGLTALEALSAGLPFLVSQNSGFGEALQEIPFGSSCIIDSEDVEKWAEAIKGVREKGRETALNDCQKLRTLYAEKYSWEKQCKDLVEKILGLVNDKLQNSNSNQGARPKEMPSSGNDRTTVKDELQTSNTEGRGPRPKPRQRARLKESPPSSTDGTNYKLIAEAQKLPAGSVSELESNRVEEKSVLPPRRRNSLQEVQLITEQRIEHSLFSGYKLIHLFNCDLTYNLDVVEDLLNATKVKLGFDPVVEKHYCALYQMSELTTDIIPKLQMDMAFFVVHAHESRLSINEDNAGTGCANIYRALMEATGGKVIIIIGGDDNYKNEDEEDRVVISRWARRKMQSQFKAEFLNGTKNFIFSWNKNHREIHEEALRHYFDPEKKGKKFEYQPKQVVKATHASSEGAPLQKYQSMDKHRGREDLAILGCSVSEDSMQTAIRVFEDIAQKLNIAEHLSVLNLPIDEVKNYLTRNHLKFKFCVLVVDAVSVKHAYESHRQQKYEELIATAANGVVAKFIVLVCETRFSSPKDEVMDRIISIVDRIIAREKGFILKLENGKLSVDPDVLVQLMFPALVREEVIQIPDNATVLSEALQRFERINGMGPQCSIH